MALHVDCLRLLTLLLELWEEVCMVLGEGVEGMVLGEVDSMVGARQVVQLKRS